MVFVFFFESINLEFSVEEAIPLSFDPFWVLIKVLENHIFTSRLVEKKLYFCVENHETSIGIFMLKECGYFYIGNNQERVYPVVK